jgi:hypothetical protein
MAGPAFGRRVIGDKAFEAESKKIAQGAHRFGPRVRGSNTPTAAPAGAKTTHGPLVSDPVNKDETVSVREIIDALVANPATFDTLYEAELERPAGARPDALRVFLRSERENAARSDVIAEIKGLLKAKDEPVTTELSETPETDGTGSGEEGGAAKIGDELDPPKDPPPPVKDVTKMTKAELEEELDHLNGYLPQGQTIAVKGTGAEHSITKPDLVRAVQKARKALAPPEG